MAQLVERPSSDLEVVGLTTNRVITEADKNMYTRSLYMPERLLSVTLEGISTRMLSGEGQVFYIYLFIYLFIYLYNISRVIQLAKMPVYNAALINTTNHNTYTYMHLT